LFVRTNDHERLTFEPLKCVIPRVSNSSGSHGVMPPSELSRLLGVLKDVSEKVSSDQGHNEQHQNRVHSDRLDVFRPTPAVLVDVLVQMRRPKKEHRMDDDRIAKGSENERPITFGRRRGSTRVGYLRSEKAWKYKPDNREHSDGALKHNARLLGSSVAFSS